MKKGFVPLAVIAFTIIAVSAAIGGYAVVKLRPKRNNNIVQTISPSVRPPTHTISPTQAAEEPSASLYPNITSNVVSTTGTISFSIHDNGISITNESIELTLKNNKTGEELKKKNTNSQWNINNLSPANYRVYVTYPNSSYVDLGRICENCKNKQDVSSYGLCGFTVDLSPGDNLNMSCNLRSVKPLVTVTPTSISDTVPPTTNIYYPQQNGSIGYKIDGKVCAIATAPSDNVSPGNEIETEYKFDEGSWSGYAAGRGYLCADSLPNGQHVLYYHSRDKAGNTEATKTLNFSVNITGN